jgi:hypothetical protein
MNLIDCHAHCLPPTVLDALREFAAGSYLGRSLYADDGFSSLERHLALMDRFGALDCMSADRIVLGGDYPISPPEIGLGHTLPQLAKVGLPASDRAKIERSNAARLVNLP